MGRSATGPLVAAYAEASGISLRTAQRHAKSGNPDWQRFIGAEAAEGVKRKAEVGHMEPREARALAQISPLAPTDRPSFYDVSDTDLDVVQIQEKQAYELHKRSFDQWQREIGTPGGQVMAAMLMREIPKLRSDHVKARKAREDWEVRQRITITRGEFEEFVGKFLDPFIGLVRAIPTELATLVNPENPDYARRQLIEWQRSRAEPAGMAMLDAAGEVLTA